MASFILTAFLAFGFTNFNQNFPLHPESFLTPGSLCEKPTSHRYPEQIAYCKRDVHSETKRAIIADYDANFGFQIGRMNRKHFKIDHLIPLCAGGSNEVDNLWPQHKSVYELTDPLEPLICEKMALGKLSQERAVFLILKAKHNLDFVPQALAELHSL